MKSPQRMGRSGARAGSAPFAKPLKPQPHESAEVSQKAQGISRRLEHGRRSGGRSPRTLVEPSAQISTGGGAKGLLGLASRLRGRVRLRSSNPSRGAYCRSDGQSDVRAPTLQRHVDCAQREVSVIHRTECPTTTKPEYRSTIAARYTLPRPAMRNSLVSLTQR